MSTLWKIDRNSDLQVKLILIASVAWCFILAAGTVYGDVFNFHNSSKHAVWVWIKEDGAASYRRPSELVHRGETKLINVNKMDNCYLAAADASNNVDYIGFIRKQSNHDGTPSYIYDVEYTVIYKPVFESKTQRDRWGRFRTHTVKRCVPETISTDNSRSVGLIIKSADP